MCYFRSSPGDRSPVWEARRQEPVPRHRQRDPSPSSRRQVRRVNMSPGRRPSRNAVASPQGKRQRQAYSSDSSSPEPPPVARSRKHRQASSSESSVSPPRKVTVAARKQRSPPPPTRNSSRTMKQRSSSESPPPPPVHKARTKTKKRNHSRSVSPPPVVRQKRVSRSVSPSVSRSPSPPPQRGSRPARQSMSASPEPVNNRSTATRAEGGGYGDGVASPVQQAARRKMPRSVSPMESPKKKSKKQIAPATTGSEVMCMSIVFYIQQSPYYEAPLAWSNPLTRRHQIILQSAEATSLKHYSHLAMHQTRFPLIIHAHPFYKVTLTRCHLAMHAANTAFPWQWAELTVL